MIRLTRLNHTTIFLNSDLIVHLEVTPDTVITLVTGQKIVVLESPDEVVERVIRFRHALGAAGAKVPPLRLVDEPDTDDKPVRIHGS
jgi:flagellar protein FlbD